MADLDAFFAAILDYPDDVRPKLVLADWLEERGDPRGAWLRYAVALRRATLTVPTPTGWGEWAGRQDELRAALRHAADAGPVTRGFLRVAASLFPAALLAEGEIPEDVRRRQRRGLALGELAACGLTVPEPLARQYTLPKVSGPLPSPSPLVRVWRWNVFRALSAIPVPPPW